MPNAKLYYSVTKRNVILMMMLVLLFLTAGVGCTLDMLDDPLAFEPSAQERMDRPHHPQPQNMTRTYTMKQKLFFFHDEYVIKDQDNIPVFYVTKKQFTFGNKFSFRDENGVELAYISERVLSLLPKYKILCNGQEVAIITKKLKLINTKFSMKIRGAEDIKITGDFWNYNYAFTRNGQVVAEVSRQPLAWNDTYWIKIAPRENDVLILAAAAIIDMVCHSPENDVDYHPHHHHH